VFWTNPIYQRELSGSFLQIHHPAQSRAYALLHIITDTTSSDEQLKTVPRDAKWKRVQEVQHLHQSGVGKREIARRTGLKKKIT